MFTRSTSVADDAADLLALGQILGWFQGRMERYGPRALGHRSILASPLLAGMKEVVNERIKHREPYRPFAGAVPEEEASTFFEIDGPSPYMQFAFSCDSLGARQDSRGRSQRDMSAADGKPEPRRFVSWTIGWPSANEPECPYC